MRREANGTSVWYGPFAHQKPVTGCFRDTNGLQGALLRETLPLDYGNHPFLRPHCRPSAGERNLRRLKSFCQKRATGFEPATSSLGKGTKSTPKSTKTLYTLRSYARVPGFARSQLRSRAVAKNRGISAFLAPAPTKARKMRGRKRRGRIQLACKRNDFQ